MLERYPLKAGRYSSHSKILHLLGEGKGKSLLDVGCAQGHLLSAAMDNGWVTTGIEYNEDDAKIAQSCGLNVFRGSAEQELLRMTGKFDVIVIADVLEHLVDPDVVLRLISERISHQGKVIISLPNVAHLSVRFALFAGRFNYSDRGILDRTHLHFYTRKSIMALCKSNGLTINSWTVTPAPVEEVLPIMHKYIALRWILNIGDKLASLWKSGLAYQFVIEATPRQI
jgi:methionine biosynthesis protein MetW